MSTELDPIVGNWYRPTEKEEPFRVVEIDEDEGTITVQNPDGDLEQIEEDAWFELDIEPAEQPEDWTEPADVETDDPEYSEVEVPDWRAREASPSAKEDWDDDDEGDDWDEDGLDDYDSES